MTWLELFQLASAAVAIGASAAALFFSWRARANARSAIEALETLGRFAADRNARAEQRQNAILASNPIFNRA